MAKVKSYTDIRWIPVDEIVPYWNNPRSNTKTREALVDVYREIGFNQPILVDKKNVIVKGHARYYAAKIAGIESLPCLVTNRTDESNREDRILDNAIQDLSTWDYEELKEQMQHIDMDIAHIMSTEQAVEAVDTDIPQEEEEPSVFLVCPECGKEHVLPKSDLLVRDEVIVECGMEGAQDEV